MAESGGATGGRAQTGLIGLILLVALTVMGTTAILALGSTAFQDSRTSSQIGSAEHAMTQFDSRTSLVALGGAGSQTASVPLQGRAAELNVEEDAGWINVSIRNASNGSVTERVMNVTMGAVIYENGETTMAYQGGGVWKDAGGRSTMISPPEFHYRTEGGDNPTLTMPMVLVRGDGSLGGRVTVTKNGSTEAKYPKTGNADRSNPLEDGDVNITVQSAYYEAWGTFFEERTTGEVTYHHDQNQVSITLVVPGNVPPKIGQALALSTSDKITIQGAGGSSFTDTYNSSQSDYSGTSAPHNGTVLAQGNVELTGGAEIFGDLNTEGPVNLGGGTQIHGNVSHGGSFTCAGGGGGSCSRVDGWVAANGSAPDYSPIGDTVREKVNDLRSSNDNAAVTAINESTDTWNGSESTLTLDSGKYFISSEDLESTQTLEFDTSGGDITLAVDDDIVWDGGTTVEVTNPDSGIVKIYTTGSKFHVIGSGTDVGDVTTDKAPSLRVYAPPGLWTKVHDHADFVGIVYAPGTSANPGSIDVTTQGEIFGGVVGGGETTLQAGGSIHYDSALQESGNTISPGGNTQARITYLHISVNRVNVTAT